MSNYKAWDRYDADKAINEVESIEDNAAPVREMSRKASQLTEMAQKQAAAAASRVRQ